MFADLKFALRSLLKTPGFTIVAVLTLALGIGANVGIFSFVNALLVRPLPLPSVSELVFIGEHSQQVPTMSVSYPNYLDWRERQTSFVHLGIFRGQTLNHVGRTETERIRGAQFSHDMWPTLGVKPKLGRWFTADDDKPGAARTVLISEVFWLRTLGGRADVLGEKITLSGEIYEIIGVMPADFRFPSNGPEAWIPFGLVADQNMNRGNHPGLYAIGRLKPGASLESARTDMVAIAKQLEREHAQTNTGNSVSMNTLVAQSIGPAVNSIWILFAAACGVFLIAGANVANLLLARATARAQDFAIRAAIGATRWQLIRLVLLESLLLGLAGTGLGLIVADATMDGIRSLIPANFPLVTQVTLDRNVLSFAILAGVGVTLIFGLVPALLGSRINLSGALSAGTRAGGGQVHARWRSVLVACEFALTVMLLFVSGLMLRTINNLYRADTGLRTDHVLSFSYGMSGRDWTDSAKRTQLLERALEKLSALPGVTHAALTNPLPFAGGGNQTFFLPEGMDDPGPGKWFSTENNAASAGYFEAMRIPLLRGRTFTDREKPADERVCLIDTRFAETHFAKQDPLGKRLRLGGSGNTSNYATIIGIVGHVENYGIGQDTRVQLYFPYRQSPPNNVSFVLRTTLNPSTSASAVRAIMREIEPTLPVFNLQTMDELFDLTVTNHRIMLTLLTVFGGLALLLAAIGLYGVMSYIVGQRTREVGIRMALGATAGSVRQLLLGQGLRLAAYGLGVGLLACLGIARLLTSVLYEVSPYDPASFAAVSILLIIIGLFSSWLPARRATKVDPMVALRAE